MSRSLIYMRPLEVLSVRAEGNYASSVHQAWSRLFAWMDANELGAEVNIGYGLAHDDPRNVPAERCRYEACIEVPARVGAASIAELGRQVLPPGPYACERLTGSYDAMGAAVSHIRDQWVPRNGLDVDCKRPVITIYRNNPRYCPTEMLHADICLPIAFPDASTARVA